MKLRIDIPSEKRFRAGAVLVDRHKAGKRMTSGKIIVHPGERVEDKINEALGGKRTLRAIEDRVGISDGHLSHIFKGQRPLTEKTAAKLEAALHIDLTHEVIQQALYNLQRERIKTGLKKSHLLDIGLKKIYCSKNGYKSPPEGVTTSGEEVKKRVKKALEGRTKTFKETIKEKGISYSTLYAVFNNTVILSEKIAAEVEAKLGNINLTNEVVQQTLYTFQKEKNELEPWRSAEKKHQQTSSHPAIHPA